MIPAHQGMPQLGASATRTEARSVRPYFACTLRITCFQEVFENICTHCCSQLAPQTEYEIGKEVAQHLREAPNRFVLSSSKVQTQLLADDALRHQRRSLQRGPFPKRQWPRLTPSPLSFVQIIWYGSSSATRASSSGFHPSRISRHSSRRRPGLLATEDPPPHAECTTAAKATKWWARVEPRSFRRLGVQKKRRRGVTDSRCHRR